jgi:hypothetical protein
MQTVFENQNLLTGQVMASNLFVIATHLLDATRESYVMLCYVMYIFRPGARRPRKSPTGAQDVLS